MDEFLDSDRLFKFKNFWYVEKDGIRLNKDGTYSDFKEFEGIRFYLGDVAWFDTQLEAEDFAKQHGGITVYMSFR